MLQRFMLADAAAPLPRIQRLSIVGSAMERDSHTL
jgi:hypothetical protein